MTNHHVGADALQKLRHEGHDYVSDGFYARTQAEELKCLDLELNVLIEHRGRDRPGQRRGQAGHGIGRGARKPAGR